MPVTNALNNLLDSLQILLALVVVTAALYAGYRRRHRPIDIAGASVLLSYYTDGASLHPVAKGRINDMPYSALVIANPGISPGSASGGGLLYRVVLPFSSSIHLVGIPRKSGAIQLDPGGSGLMEAVHLEGDFPSYFSLFCEKGMQADARYVLDPKAMAFVVDFCQSHNWEIVRNELYFLQTSGQHDPADKTSMFEDIETFVEQIRPAVERPLTQTEKKASAAYGEDHRDTLPCPVCTRPMQNKEGCFACPADHGILAQGRMLRNIVRQPKWSDRSPAAAKDHRNQPLTCPSCGTRMRHVPYNFSKIVIDSCNKCPYRWVDMDELTSINHNEKAPLS